MYDKKAVQKYKSKNREAILEYQKEYYKKNKEKILESRKGYYIDKKEELEKESVVIGTRVERAAAEKLKSELSKEGKSVTVFIREAINEYLQKHE